jgi:hypothetical protein
MSLIPEVVIVPTEGQDNELLAKEFAKRGYTVSHELKPAAAWIFPKTADLLEQVPQGTVAIEVEGEVTTTKHAQKITQATTIMLKRAVDELTRTEDNDRDRDNDRTFENLARKFKNRKARTLRRGKPSKGEPFRLEGDGIHYGVHRKYGPHVASGPAHVYRGHLYSSKKGRRPLNKDEREIADTMLTMARRSL